MSSGRSVVRVCARVCVCARMRVCVDVGVGASTFTLILKWGSTPTSRTRASTTRHTHITPTTPSHTHTHHTLAHTHAHTAGQGRHPAVPRLARRHPARSCWRVPGRHHARGVGLPRRRQGSSGLGCPRGLRQGVPGAPWGVGWCCAVWSPKPGCWLWRTVTPRAHTLHIFWLYAHMCVHTHSTSHPLTHLTYLLTQPLAHDR